MGGVPYSSLGCINCRKRKIRCDLQKPQCGRCLKSRIVCLGYEKDRNFVYHVLPSKVSPRGETKRPVRQLVGHLKPLTLPYFFNMNTELRTQLFSTFMDTFFASNTKINSRDDSFYFLLASFPKLAGESALLDRSVIALASSFMANKSNDGSLAIQGLQIYNSALNVMARALQKKTGSGPFMLYTTIIFHTYETLYSSDAALRSLFSHIQGTAALIKQFGLDDSPLTSALLTRHKWSAAYCLVNSQYGFNVDFDILTMGRERSPTDELFGQLGDCLSLRGDMENTTQLSGRELKAALEALLQRFFEFQKHQVHWNHLYGGVFSPRCEGQHRRKPRTPEQNEDTSICAHEFTDLTTAKTYILFYLSSTMMARMVYQAEKLLYGYSDPRYMLFAAGEICRAVAYCMRPELLISVRHVVMFTVTQASRTYIEYGDEEMFLWCQGIYAAIEARGIGLASRVSEEDWALWRATWNQKPIES